MLGQAERHQVRPNADRYPRVAQRRHEPRELGVEFRRASRDVDESGPECVGQADAAVDGRGVHGLRAIGRARVVAVGYPHHITQRGNNRQDIFFDDNDREEYLGLLNRHARKYSLDVLSYCLMSNHVHIIAVPHTPEALAQTFNFTHMRYSQYYNKKMEMSGHLWQGRFYSCIMDEDKIGTATNGTDLRKL